LATGVRHGLVLALSQDFADAIPARVQAYNRAMTEPQPRNPLHGITLAAMLNALVARHGWEDLGRQINIRCFTHDPSIASSLKFLRRTPWARERVESLYVAARR
jgi:uncharacterized protein (DUF2132 family)